MDERQRRGATRPATGLATAVLSVALVVAGVFTAAPVDGPMTGATPAPEATSSPALSSPAPPPAARATPTFDREAGRRAALTGLLDARAAAVLARDTDGWLRTVDPAASAFAAEQARSFANLADVPLAAWGYQFAGTAPDLPPDRAAQVAGADGRDPWVARVVLVYRLDGTPGDVRHEQHLTLVERNGGYRVAADSDGVTADLLWDLGPVSTVRGERSLVLGTVGADILRRYARESDEAAVRVDEVWGVGWPRTVVVLVPATQAQLAVLLQRDDGAGLDQIAAVTTGEGAQGAAAADRVIVNPAAFDTLGDLGRQVVLTHEVVHVAMRGTGAGDVPTWLSEGYADWVAYRGTDVEREVVAADVLEQVRLGTGPQALPVTDAFDPTRTTVSPSYSASWLAVDLLVRTYGEAALTAFVRTAARADPATGVRLPDADGDVDVGVDQRAAAAFVSVLGVEAAQFEAAWLEYIGALAG